MSVRWLSFYGLLAVLVVVLGGIYIWLESVLSKGPDDWGAETHAEHILQEKFGQSASLDTTNYVFHKDTPQSPSGTYVFQYERAGQKGRVVCHYDKATGTFSGDGVVPAK